MNTLTQIQDFLGKKRIAFIGVSRNEKDYTRGLFREMYSRGYDVIPVNPNAAEIEGMKCYNQISEITPAPEAALILTPSLSLETILSECNYAGIKSIWVYNGKDKGENLKQTGEYCKNNGISFIYGLCPFMFLKNSSFIHRFHGFITRLTGSYPV